MVQCSSLPFASLSTSAYGTEQRPRQGMPLFTLARAAAAALVDTDLRRIRVQGDGRCMFRAIAIGLARNPGKFLGEGAVCWGSGLCRVVC